MRAFYAGVGSRETPPEVLKSMRELARELEQFPFILRTGGAEGADTAFASGVENPKMLEVYLPWDGFNGLDRRSKGVVRVTTEQRNAAIALSILHHPGRTHLTPAAKKLHGRNWFQVHGLDGSLPSLFVVCWTPDGCEDGKKTGRGTGGTGQALRLASILGIPIFNLKHADADTRLWSWLDTIVDEVF